MEKFTPRDKKVFEELVKFRKDVRPVRPITCQGCFQAIGKVGQGSPDEFIIKNCRGFVANGLAKPERKQSSGCRLIHRS